MANPWDDQPVLDVQAEPKIQGNLIIYSGYCPQCHMVHGVANAFDPETGKGGHVFHKCGVWLRFVVHPDYAEKLPELQAQLPKFDSVFGGIFRNLQGAK